MARIDTGFDTIGDLAPPGASADALYELGLAYSAGRDVALDLVAAHKWFNLAAMRGNGEAQRQRAEVARDLSRAELARAQRSAREWLSRH